MSRRRSVGGWFSGLLALGACVGALVLLFLGDEPSPSPDRTTRTSSTVATSANEGASRADAEGGAPDDVTPAPLRDGARAATTHPASTDAERTDADLTHADLRARLAAGEPGMEVLASRLPEAAQTVALAPRWQAGDEWLVETWYRQLQAPEVTWSGPALWRFRVEHEVSFRDEPCYELIVTRADEPQVAPVTLWITRSGGRLAGVETTVVQQGKASRSLYTPEPAVPGDPGGDAGVALRAPVTTAPVRLPSLGALATVAPPGLPFDRLPVDTPADAPPPAALVGAGGDYLDVEFADPVDGTTIRQRWSPGDLRWPVVSRTETTLSVRRS